MTDFDLNEVDRLLKTTKQVRKRLDLDTDCLLYTSDAADE